MGTGKSPGLQLANQELPAPASGPARTGSSNRAARADHVHEPPMILQADSIPLNAAVAAGGHSANNKIITGPAYVHGMVRAIALKVYGTTLDAGANYCFGIYNLNGTLICRTGSVAIAAGLNSYATLFDGAGNQITPTNASFIEIAAGAYIFAMTGSAIVGRVQSGGAPAVAGQLRYWGELAAGGGATLPASIAPASIVEGVANFPWISLVSL